MVIAYTVDDNIDCQAQLRQSIASVRVFLKDSVEVIVFTNSPESVGELGQDRTIDVTGVIEKYALDHTRATWHGNRCSPMMLYRLAFAVTPELNDYDEVFYLDSDTEIWRNDALKIFEADHSDVDIVGIKDHVSSRSISGRVHRLRSSCSKAWHESSRKADLLNLKYINSGVLLFNLKRLRTRTDPDQFLRHILDLMNREPPKFPDQDMINLMYDIRFISQAGYNWWPDGVSGPPIYIRHYVGRHYGTEWDKRWRPKVLSAANVKVTPRGKDISECCDGSFILCYTGSPSRKTSMVSEAARVGLYPEIIWQFPTPFDEYFLKTVPHTHEFDRKMAFTNNWFGHYRVMKTAYGLGMKSVLVMEDDCRFLKDVDHLNEIVRSIPDDFDLALLDHFYCKWTPAGNSSCYSDMVDDKATDHWSRFSGELYSASCYMLSRRAMERLIWLHESVIDTRTPKRMMRITDNWHNSGNLGNGMHLYFSPENCAIQRNSSSDSSRMSNTEKMNRNYMNAGIDLRAYAD